MARTNEEILDAIASTTVLEISAMTSALSWRLRPMVWLHSETSAFRPTPVAINRQPTESLTFCHRRNPCGPRPRKHDAMSLFGAVCAGPLVGNPFGRGRCGGKGHKRIKRAARAEILFFPLRAGRALQRSLTAVRPSAPPPEGSRAGRTTQSP